MDTVKQGIAFGTGSAIAHQGVHVLAGAFTGTPDTTTATVPATEHSSLCSLLVSEYASCMSAAVYDHRACEPLQRLLRNCNDIPP